MPYRHSGLGVDLRDLGLGEGCVWVLSTAYLQRRLFVLAKNVCLCLQEGVCACLCLWSVGVAEQGGQAVTQRSG